MEHHQSAQGTQTLIILLCVVAIVICTAFYLSFIRKDKSGHGH